MSITRDEIVRLRGPELAELLRTGHPIDPAALVEFEYRGISLNLPALVERLTWKTFQKVFHRMPDGRIRGWNVRLEQLGLEAASQPLRRAGRPVTFGHYQVVELTGHRLPRPCPAGLLIHYGLGGNLPLDPTVRLRDPITALQPGNADLLLGWSYVQLPLAAVPTPSYFLLERERPLTYVAQPPWPPWLFRRCCEREG